MSAPTRAAGAALPLRTPLLALLAVATTVALAVAVIALPPRHAAGFDDADWSWSNVGSVLTGVDADAARVEALPDGGVVALLLADGADHGHPGDAVLIDRTFSGGAFTASTVTPLGASGDVPARTFDTAVDDAGRVLVVWAERGASSGQWTVRSTTRATDGTWGAPEQVYETRTDGDFSDTIEIGIIRPRLARTGGDVTLAWSTVVGMRGARVDVDTEPFRARRWSGGVWGPAISSDGYGAAGASYVPTNPDSVQVTGDPQQATRTGDGRLSFVFTLRKRRAVHSTDHPLSNGYTGPNLPDVWDGVPEAPWDADSTSAWVMHLDPGDSSWSEPAPLVTTGGPLVVCNPPDLPSDPPFTDHWDAWRAYSEDPGISTACPADRSTVKSAVYAPDGALRITLDHQSSPTARVVINQFLTDPCDAPSPDDRFCFDAWGTPDWAVDWPTARVQIAPDAGQPGADSVAEGPWPVTGRRFVLAVDGSLSVTDASGADGKAITFSRPGGDVQWVPDPTAPGSVSVSHAFVADGDIAAFYHYGSADDDPACGMAVLTAGTAVVAPAARCVGGGGQRDAVQLTDQTLAFLDGTILGSPLRIYGPDAATGTPSTATTATTATGDPTAEPSVFTPETPPRITGRLKVGKVLRVRVGTWHPAPSHVAIRWYAGTKPIKPAAKASRSKFRLTPKQRGKRISVRLRLTRPGVTSLTRTVRVKGRVR